MHSLHILAYIYTNKNLLYTAGVSRILGLQICSPTVGPCSYKSKEACNFSEYKAKCFIRSTGCQHILIWYVFGIYTYITHKHIFDQKENSTCMVTLAVVSSRRKEWSRAQTSIFTIENHFQMAPQASWPSSTPLGLQNHCLGSRAGDIYIYIYIRTHLRKSLEALCKLTIQIQIHIVILISQTQQSRPK